MTLLWTLDGPKAPIHIFGAGPAGKRRWHDAEIEQLVGAADVFWNETPEFTDTDARLAAEFGIEPERPLDAWLTEGQRARVDAAASSVGVDPASLRPMRPWLCAQVIKRAAQAAAGLARFEDGAEAVLTGVAHQANIGVRSESPTAEAILRLFSSLARGAELDLLSMEIDAIEEGLDQITRDAESVNTGDESVGERFVEHMRTRYPALYEPLCVKRNREWIARIRGMLDRGERAFIYVGSAHLAGPDSVQAMLAAEGIMARRSA